MTASRYRLDDLRHFAVTLLSATGLAPARASGLATHLLWHDAAGLEPFGFATLPRWLEWIEGQVVDRSAEGTVTRELTGTAVFDGQNGVGPLLLARAGEVAVAKARDAGVGFVRVLNLETAGPAGAIAAELAIGPFVGIILAHDSSWSVALPAQNGLPIVFDSTFKTALASDAKAPDSVAPLERVFPWASVLAPAQGWLVCAIAVGALEPLGTFHERVADAFGHHDGFRSELSPVAWERRRHEAREHGVAIRSATWEALRPWVERFGKTAPEPASRAEDSKGPMAVAEDAR